MLLPQMEYKFKNLTKEEYSNGKVFYFYCDNLQEGVHILSWLEEYNPEMRLVKRGYKGISNYISVYDICGEKYTIIICSFYHNGELPTLVRQLIFKIDKPDVVIYLENENKIICAIENTQTGFIGNATWQRHGRIMNFLKEGIPFIFFAYYSKKDNSQNKIRKPSPLLVLSFFALSIQYKTPAVLSLFEHEDEKQNFKNKDGSKMIDTRKESLSYLLSLMKDGQNSEKAFEKLKKCFYNMKYYYKKGLGRVKEKELPKETLKLLRKDNFEDEVVNKIKNLDTNYPIFFKGDRSKKYIFKWKPVSKKQFYINEENVGIKEYLENQFDYEVDFYQLSPKCPVGITFDTKKLIDTLNKKSNNYWEDILEKVNLPTIIILLRLMKGGELSLPDPYNGRIPAFYELYQQSFGEMNCIVYLIDHSTNDEYEVEKAKNMKIYKPISNYATTLVDRDLNIFEHNSNSTLMDSRGKYKEKTTEDNVTSFFETILNKENIEASFINPPSGSWSDFKLCPTDKYLYINRDKDRPDIAYYEPESGLYYIGESKADYKFFKNEEKYNKEVNRIHRLADIIKNNIEIDFKYKTFIIFKGSEENGLKIIEQIHAGQRNKIDYVIVIQEDNESNEYNIKMKILEV